jgi:hypothetical protein
MRRIVTGIDSPGRSVVTDYRELAGDPISSEFPNTADPGGLRRRCRRPWRGFRSLGAFTGTQSGIIGQFHRTRACRALEM